MRRHKSYVELIMVGISMWYFANLNSYNKVLDTIKDDAPNLVIGSVNMVREPEYVKYLIGGLCLIFFLGWSIKYYWTSGDSESIVMIFLNTILIITAMVLLWSPIFVAALVVMVSAVGVQKSIS